MTTPGGANDGAADAGNGPTYEQHLAMAGLATLLATPALMHSLKGHVHNLGLLTELLQKEAVATPVDATMLRAAALRRAEMLRAELRALHRQVQKLEALTMIDAEIDAGACDIRESLDEMLPTTRFEAARRHVVVKLDVEPAVGRAKCAPRAFQQIVFAFVAHAVRHCSERATVTVTAMRDGASTRLCFDCDRPVESPALALERKLLGWLALRLGAQVSNSPAMCISFDSAP